MTLGEKIYYYRKKGKLSQEELAARVGVSRQAVSKWELSEATPEVEKLLALSQAFSITTDQLLSPQAPEAEPTDPSPCGSASQEQTGACASRQRSAGELPEDELRHYGKRLGSLIRRKGYLAGYILSLYGLGPFFGGLIFTVVAGKMGQSVSFFRYGADLPNGLLVSPENGSWAFAGQEFPSLPQTIGLLLMLLGLVIIVGGILLAQVLKRKMTHRESEKRD